MKTLITIFSVLLISYSTVFAQQAASSTPQPGTIIHKEATSSPSAVKVEPNVGDKITSIPSVPDYGDWSISFKGLTQNLDDYRVEIIEQGTDKIIVLYGKLIEKKYSDLNNILTNDSQFDNINKMEGFRVPNYTKIVLWSKMSFAYLLNGNAGTYAIDNPFINSSISFPCKKGDGDYDIKCQLKVDQQTIDSFNQVIGVLNVDGFTNATSAKDIVNFYAKIHKGSMTLYGYNISYSEAEFKFYLKTSSSDQSIFFKTSPLITLNEIPDEETVEEPPADDEGGGDVEEEPSDEGDGDVEEEPSGEENGDVEEELSGEENGNVEETTDAESSMVDAGNGATVVEETVTQDKIGDGDKTDARADFDYANWKDGKGCSIGISQNPGLIFIFIYVFAISMLFKREEKNKY